MAVCTRVSQKLLRRTEDAGYGYRTVVAIAKYEEFRRRTDHDLHLDHLDLTLPFGDFNTRQRAGAYRSGIHLLCLADVDRELWCCSAVVLYWESMFCQ